MSSIYPTPIYSHAGRGQFADVYEPAEDSFLLIDALEQDVEKLRQLRCTDVNSAAAQCTEKTASCNEVSLQPVVTDLVDCLLPRLSGKVDILLFNPPYVVTPPEEVGSHGIEAAWAGGRQGREVIDRFLPLVTQLLSNKGLFYLITIKENCPEEIIRLLGEMGLVGAPCLSRRAGNESLSVLRFHRTQGYHDSSSPSKWRSPTGENHSTRQQTLANHQKQFSL